MAKKAAKPDVETEVEDPPAEDEAEVLDPVEHPEGDTSDFDDEFAKQAAGDTEEYDGSDKAQVKEPDTEYEPADDGAKDSDEDKADDEPDIWANATPDQKAAHGAAVATAHKWESDQGRAAADRARIAALEKTVADAAAETAADDATRPLDLKKVFEGEEWGTVTTELPELAGPLKKLFESSEARSAKLEAELSSFSGERRKVLLDRQYDIALSTHSDLEAVVSDPAFLAWSGTQPDFVQEMLGHNADTIVNGLEAAHVVSLYKASEGYVAPATAAEAEVEVKAEPAGAAKPSASGEPTKRERANKRRLESGAAAPSKGPGSPSGPPDEFEGAFDHYAAQAT